MSLTQPTAMHRRFVSQPCYLWWQDQRDSRQADGPDVFIFYRPSFAKNFPESTRPSSDLVFAE